MLDYEPELKETYALDKYDLYYKNSVGNRDRIKLEINYLKRSTILEPIEMNFAHIFDFEDFNVLTLKIEDLFGRKLNALVRRTTPKDLYEIYRLLQSSLKYDMDLTKKCFIFSLCLDNDPRKVEYNVFEETTPHDVWKSLTPLLKKEENVEFEEMKKEVKLVLEKMCDFSKR
ncbi:MAG: nucleotidyl transferase AbiEii/AbiGii toxin family protein [Thermoplasmatota archaeon]